MTSELSLTVAGVRLACRNSGALWLQSARTLVVADLHLEKGSAYAVRGQLLPPFDTAETLSRLEAEVVASNPQTMVLLGDSFHDRRAGERLSRETHARFQALAEGRRMIWVRGNHDADLPAGLPGSAVEDFAVGGMRLVHEPGETGAEGEVAGHLHPCARVKGRSGSVRRRCFVTDGRRIVLPAFGAYAGGLNVCNPAISGLLQRPIQTVVLGANRVYAVAWTSLIRD